MKNRENDRAMTDILDGTSTAEGVQRLPNPENGRGRWRITMIRTQKSQTGAQVYAVIEGECVEHPAHTPGTMCKLFIKDLTQHAQARKADLRVALEAIAGRKLSDAEVKAAVYRNALAGRLVDVDTTREPNKKKPGAMYCNHVYLGVVGQEPLGAIDTSDASPAPAPSAPAPAPAAPPPPAAAPAPFDPTAFGWAAHPAGGGWFYKGQDVKQAADIRAIVGA
jgi:hypothetical protein